MSAMRLVWITCAALALCLVASMPAYAVYAYPEVEPLYDVQGGYRFVGLEGSERAAEYEYLESSPNLAFKAIVFPFPHRIHLEMDIYNKNDYHSDLGYAYGDNIVMRWVRQTMFHNLDNVELVELDPIFSVDRRDRGEDYGTRADMDHLYLRGKPLKFPFHLYVKARRIEQEGTAQQRFLAGPTDFVRTSRKRDIDWASSEVIVGANSHLGPIELEYSHSEKRFEPAGDDVMSDIYSTGTYPHNVFSETEGSSDTLMVHSSYTGRIVASATLSRTERENTTSGAEAQYTVGAGEVIWTPSVKGSLALKYRKKTIETDTPGTLPAGYLGFGAFAVDTIVSREAMSSTEERYTAVLNYRATHMTAFNAEYRITETSREDNADWNVPDSTSERQLDLSLRTRLPKRVKLRALYRHVEADDPAYNTRPERMDSGMVHLTLFPAQRTVAVLTYTLASERRVSLEFADSQAENRKVSRQRLMAAVSYALTERAALNAAYAYFQRKVVQDMYYDNGAVFSDDVEYTNKAHHYSLGLDYRTKGELSLRASLSRTDAESGFQEGGTAVDSFSENEVSQSRYELAAHKGKPDGLRYGVDLKYFDFDDRLENDDNPAQEDGSAYMVLVSVSTRL